MNAAARTAYSNPATRLDLSPGHSNRHLGWKLGGVVAAYLLSGRIGLAVPFTSGNVSPVWPPAGIALAAMLLFGYRMWPAVALGAFFVNFFSDIPHLAAGGIAVGNTVGPLCGAWLMRRLPNFKPSLTRLRDVLGMIVAGALGGTAVSATVGTAVLFLTGVHPWSGFTPAWLMWWWGDAMGVLIVTPVALTLPALMRIQGPRRWFELGYLVVGAAGTSLMIFDPRLRLVGADAFAFCVFPFVLWGAIRFEAAGAAIVSCLISAIAVWGTAHGFGPFIKGHALQNATLLQSFLAVTSVSGIALAAVIAERAQLVREQSSREALERSEKNYRGIVETACEGIWKLDSEFVTTFVNGRMAELLGRTVDEMLGRPVFEFYFEEDFEQKLAQLQRHRSGVSEQFETRFRKKDGSVLWARIAASPILGDNGDVQGALAMVSDVTHEKRNELKERLWRNKIILLSRAVEQTADSVVITDRDGFIDYVNPAFEVTTGYTREEVVSKTPRILKSGLHDEEFYRQLWAKIKDGETFRGTLVNRKKSGGLYWAEQTITPVRNEDNQITHFVSVLKDITDLRKRQEHEFQLQLARELQQRFYAPAVSVPGLDLGISAHLAAETGGDCVDVIAASPDSIFLAVGDATGHGISAAILIALARAYVRAFVHLGMDTGQVLTKVNQMLVDDLRTMFHVESSWFVTLLLVHIDLKSHTLAYASAGHVPGFLLNRSRHIDQVLNSTGVPLGLFAEARFGCSGFPLEPDHLLVLLTDGATEATNASGEPCGYQRLVDFALRNAAEPAGVIADRIYTTVRGFAGERTADDDLSIVVAKVQ